MRRVRLTSAMKLDDPYVVGDAGAPLTLPDHVAKGLIALGNAIYLDDEPVPGPTRAELEAKEEAISAGEVTEEEVKRPVANAPKSAWIRYAVSVDEKLSEERAELMTKADLMSKYGERF
jgi:hypothetical protein